MLVAYMPAMLTGQKPLQLVLRGSSLHPWVHLELPSSGSLQVSHASEALLNILEKKCGCQPGYNQGSAMSCQAAQKAQVVRLLCMSGNDQSPLSDHLQPHPQERVKHVLQANSYSQ